MQFILNQMNPGTKFSRHRGKVISKQYAILHNLDQKKNGRFHLINVLLCEGNAIIALRRNPNKILLAVDINIGYILLTRNTKPHISQYYYHNMKLTCFIFPLFCCLYSNSVSSVYKIFQSNPLWGKIQTAKQGLSLNSTSIPILLSQYEINVLGDHFISFSLFISSDNIVYLIILWSCIFYGYSKVAKWFRIKNYVVRLMEK